jgi:precorrin-6Y C5,15-methyltransferase (decarboxylating)
VYLTGGDGAASLAKILSERGYGTSRFVVLEQLGGPDEKITWSIAKEWVMRTADPLHAVAVEAVKDGGALLLPTTPGLPDEAFESDGALTKWAVRAVTLAALAPTPGALLWDVGAGSGSVAIEWLRAEPSARAVAVERRQDRLERVRRNAHTLGVPQLQTVLGDAPAVLAELEPPDAIFIGGGFSADGMLEACIGALAPGGRLVANAVTLEGEAALSAARAEYGGELTRLEVAHAGPLGTFTAWRPQLPVVIWSVTR